MQDFVHSTSTVTDKNFSSNQGHKKEFQFAFVLGKVNL